MRNQNQSGSETLEVRFACETLFPEIRLQEMVREIWFGVQGAKHEYRNPLISLCDDLFGKNAVVTVIHYRCVLDPGHAAQLAAALDDVHLPYPVQDSQAGNRDKLWMAGDRYNGIQQNSPCRSVVRDTEKHCYGLSGVWGCEREDERGAIARGGCAA